MTGVLLMLNHKSTVEYTLNLGTWLGSHSVYRGGFSTVPMGKQTKLRSNCVLKESVFVQKNV